MLLRKITILFAITLTLGCNFASEIWRFRSIHPGMTESQVKHKIGPPDSVEVLHKSTYAYPALSKIVFRRGSQATKWSYNTAPGETHDLYFDSTGKLLMQGGSAQSAP